MNTPSVAAPLPPGGGQRGGRFAALDGLRGIAAVVVVLCHGLLVTPALSAAYGIGSGQLSPAETVITDSPLHVFWAGTEAVYLFFVLSGFVLTLSMTGHRRPGWPGYYCRRLLRLYLPVWASVAFAVLTFVAVAHDDASGLSGWLGVHTSSVTVGQVARDLGLIVRPGVYATQLWSLKWEVVFSLLLPVFLKLTGERIRRAWPATIAILLVAVAVGQLVSSFALFYLPMFEIGVVMASARSSLARLARRLGRGGWLVVTLAALVLLTAKWTLQAVDAGQAAPSGPLDAVSVVGAAGLVFLFLFNTTAGRIGRWPAVRWIGRRSFSLYLVHEPVIVSIAFGFRLHNGWIALLISLPITLAVTAAFYLACEAPAHRLANRVGRIVGRRGPQRAIRGPVEQSTVGIDQVAPTPT